MRKFAIFAAFCCLIISTAPVMALTVDTSGWVAGENIWNQWQDSNFAEHLDGDNGGHLDGNSHQGIDMWGAVGAGHGDPASYVSELIQGQTTDVVHGIDGGTMNYKLDEIQVGFIDISANPGQERNASVGGENNTHADLSSSFGIWNHDSSCLVDRGSVMSSEGNAKMDMSGWVSGNLGNGEASYQSQVLQSIGHERTNNVPGGTMSSYSQSTQLGTIEIEVGH